MSVTISVCTYRENFVFYPQSSIKRGGSTFHNLGDKYSVISWNVLITNSSGYTDAQSYRKSMTHQRTNIEQARL
jgi:hypothetical protein